MSTTEHSVSIPRTDDVSHLFRCCTSWYIFCCCPLISKGHDFEHEWLVCQAVEFGIFVECFPQLIYRFPNLLKVGIDLLISKIEDAYCMQKCQFRVERVLGFSRAFMSSEDF